MTKVSIWFQRAVCLLMAIGAIFGIRHGLASWGCADCQYLVVFWLIVLLFSFIGWFGAPLMAVKQRDTAVFPYRSSKKARGENFEP